MHRTIHRALSLLLSLLVGVLSNVAGCALQAYSPAPLDPAASAAAFEARSTDSPALREYMESHGFPVTRWPVQSWSLSDLTLLAFYYHPDLKVARARAKAARAEVAVASQRAPLALVPRVQHHSGRTENSSSPWSVGFDVEIPLTGAAKSSVLRDRYGYLADASALQVASVAWEVRSQVRARLLSYYASLRSVELLQAEVQYRLALTRLLERRLELGAISGTEIGNAKLGLVDAQGRLRTLRAGQERDLAALAHAMALPLQVVQHMTFDLADFEQVPAAPTDKQMQQAALLNRLDVRSKLLEYSAADADVKLEVLRQYPSFNLSPGYLWDQGDHVWSLAVGLLLPPMLGNRAGIEAAQARREVAASAFLGLQEQAISQAEGALAVYAKLAEAVAGADEMRALQDRRTQQVEKQFAAGYADRVELTQARLEASAASRSALSARIDALRARGELEDALQVPLDGATVPLALPLVLPAQHASGLARR